MAGMAPGRPRGPGWDGGDRPTADRDWRGASARRADLPA